MLQQKNYPKLTNNKESIEIMLTAQHETRVKGLCHQQDEEDPPQPRETHKDKGRSNRGRRRERRMNYFI